MCGPDLGHAPTLTDDLTRFPLPYCAGLTWAMLRAADPGTYLPTRALFAVRYDIAHGAIRLLTTTRPRRSTEKAHGAIRLRARYAMTGPDLAHGAISLRARYNTLSGPDLAHGAISLRARYNMLSGTDLAHGAISLRARCTLSGTDLSYGATSPADSLSLLHAVSLFPVVFQPPPLPDIPPRHAPLPTRALCDVRY
eukprot:500657-Rhodomonas_salina.1